MTTQSSTRHTIPPYTSILELEIKLKHNKGHPCVYTHRIKFTVRIVIANDNFASSQPLIIWHKAENTSLALFLTL